MTGGYVLADERDVRTVGTLVRRERAAGGVELSRPVVQDAAVVGDSGPTPSAPAAFLSVPKFGLFSQGVPPWSIGAGSLYGIVLPAGKRMRGTVVMSGNIYSTQMPNSPYASPDLAIAVETMRSDRQNVYGRFTYLNQNTFLGYIYYGGGFIVNSMAATLPIASPIQLDGFGWYDEILPSGEGVIYNSSPSAILVYVRTYELPTVGGFATEVRNILLSYTYTIY